MRNFDNYAYTCTDNFLIKYRRFGHGGNRNSLENLNTGYKTNGISKETRKKIKKHVVVLNLFSEEKLFEDKNNQKVKGKCKFITLTLPADQEHTDQFITKNLLGGFLNMCRKENVLRNYVWRAEKQKRGNIHYHIITDCIVSNSLIYRIWLRQCSKFGYLKKYSDKFSKMSFREYQFSQQSTGASRERLLYRYNKGEKNNWEKPNCTDVKNVEGTDGIIKYLSKYLSKENNSDNIVKGRVWAASEGVRAAAEVLYKNQEFNKTAYEHAEQILRKEVEVFDFCEVCKCSLNSIFAWFPFLFEFISSEVLKVFRPVRPGLQTALF